MALEVHHSDSGDQFEFRGGVCHLIGIGADIVGDLCQFLVADALVIDLHPLVEAINEGRGVKTYRISGFLQDRSQHSGGRAFTIGAGDVNEL